MSSDHFLEEFSLSVPAARRIDEVCDLVEAELQAGRQPRLEAYLGTAAVPWRPALLRQLLLLEWDYLQQRGGRLELSDYLTRFPEDTALIHETSAEHSAASGQTSMEQAAGRAGAPVGPAPLGLGASDHAIQEWKEQGYIILSQLGRGGMGTVYLACQTAADRLVALKVLQDGPHDGPAALDRFRREAMTLGRLQHPHIVPIFEVGEHKGRPFYSMEYCPGGSLADCLHGTLLPAAESAALLETLARATHAAHQAQVIHRDLKPGNVLLSGEARLANGEKADTSSAAPRPSPLAALVPKLADFGLAKKLDAKAQTQTGEVVGTPSYMAPEQARGESKAAGPAADVYALGAILYECLTGRPPFLGETPLDTLLQVITDDPVPPRRLQPKVPRDLETICLKCLHKEPRHRFASALELAEDLHRFLNGEPIKARPAGTLERGWRWCRRNPVVAGLLTAVLLLAAAGGTGAWLLQQQQAAARVRQRDVDQQVRLTLERGRTLLKQGWEENDSGKLASARAEADKAAEVAQSGGASAAVLEESGGVRAEVQARLDQAKKNNSLLAALLDVTAKRETKTFVQDELGKKAELAEPTLDEQYAAAFGRWGVEISSASIEDAAAQFQAQPPLVVREIVAGLEAWMRERRRQQRPEADWLPLLQLADRLDPSGLGKELRRLPANGQLRGERIAGELSRMLLPYSALLEPVLGKQQLRLRELADKADLGRQPVLGVVALARALYEGGFEQRAERLLSAVMAASPDQAVLLQSLGELLREQGKLARAIECYRAARALRPQLGVALAWALEDAGRAEEGETVLRELIRNQPDHPQMFYHLGVALVGQKKWAEAEAVYRRAIGLQDDYADAHNNLGVVLLEQKKFVDAEGSFRRAANLRPLTAKPHYDLGLALFHQKQWAKAEPNFRRAGDLRPDWAEAHYNLGLTQLYQKKITASESSFRRATVLQPNWAGAHNNLGLALFKLRDLAGAVAAVSRAIELAPGNRRYQNHLRYQIEPMVKQDQRLRAYLAGKEPPPRSAREQLDLALCAFHMERYGTAVHFFTEAFATDPKLPGRLQPPHRYNAAAAAILAASGKGQDGLARDDKARAAWRKQALDWFQADLRLWSRNADGPDPKQRAIAGEALRHWLNNGDLAAVRATDALAKLPEEERKEWQKLWDEVADVLRKVAAPL